MKKIISLFFAITIVLILNPNASAAANEDEIDLSGISKGEMSKSELINMENQLVNYGVDVTVAKDLSEKIENGKLLDSITMDIDKAVDVKVQTYDDNTEETIYTFPDGSISIVSLGDYVEVDENDLIEPQAIKGGTCKTGTGYQSCSNREVSYLNPGIFSLKFRANYSLVKNGYDKISWVGNPTIWVTTGTIGSPKLRILKSAENSLGRAEARYSAYLHLGPPFGTQTRSVSLLVGGDKAVSRSNTYY